MLKTNFVSNRSGKLLANIFITVRMHDGAYHIGQQRQICLNNQALGVADVMEITVFKVRDLPDVIAFADCGGNAEYLKKMLYRFYKGLHQESLVEVVALKWTDRNISVQEDLFKDFWSKIVDQYHPTLFNQL